MASIGNLCRKNAGNPCLACQTSSANQIHNTTELPLNLQSQVNEHHDPFIHRLPVELASKIFTFCLPYLASLEVFSHLENQWDHEYDTPMPFILAAVCSYWRRVAITTPSLWNIVSINVGWHNSHFRPIHVEVIEEWLRRSGHLPLYIRFLIAEWASFQQVSPSLAAIINHINCQSRRWRVLDLNSPGSFISLFDGNLQSAIPLEKIRVSTIKDDGTHYNGSFSYFRMDTPQLRSLVIHGLSALRLQYDRTNLTSFEATIITLPECIEIVLYCPSLQRCTFERVKPESTPHLAAHHANHSIISYLDVHNHCPQFLDCFTLPSLRNFHYDASNTPLAQIESFFRRSGVMDSLESFTIAGSDVRVHDMDELYNLFASTTSLSRLAIVERPIDDSFFERLSKHSHIQNPDIFLPRLRSLRIKGPRDFTWSSFSGLLSAVTQDTPGTRRQLLKIELELREEGAIDESVLHDIFAARKRGIKIKIIDGTGRSIIQRSRKYFSNIRAQEAER